MDNKGFALPAIGLMLAGWPLLVGIIGIPLMLLMLTGFLNDLLVALLFIVIGLFLFGKFVDSLALSDSKVFPTVMFLVSMGCVAGGLLMIKPDVFNVFGTALGHIQLQSIAMSGNSAYQGVSDYNVQSLFAVVPSNESAVFSLNPVLQMLAGLGILLFASYMLKRDK